MTTKNNMSKKDLKRMFNMNNILTQLINWAAYIIIFISLVVLVYFAFIEWIEPITDWRTFTLFAIVAVMLSWLNWNTWYKKQYESLMSEDIVQQENNKYSIHSRYYFAIKDWSDAELQLAIDKFNDEYEKKWLRWVEKYTGHPIKTCEKVELDEYGNPIILEQYELLDENGEPEYDIDFNPIIVTKYKTITVKGILDLPYKGFKHKLIMWRIKNHKYPQSGYKTSMELMSLFSFQESNMNKRNLTASRKFYARNSIEKLFTLLLSISIGGAIIPHMISGQWWTAILKLIIALGSVFTSIIMGAVNGIKGARIKLSVVEDACVDLEQWANKKPVIAPYKEPDNTNKLKNDNEENEVITNIFQKAEEVIK